MLDAVVAFVANFGQPILVHTKMCIGSFWVIAIGTELLDPKLSTTSYSY